jgi:hypothetical protein
MTARETLDRHCKAAIEMKVDIVVGDLTPEVAANIQPIAGALAAVQPERYEILSENQEGDNYIFEVKYIGKDNKSLCVRSKWALFGDDWKVVKGEVVK